MRKIIVNTFMSLDGVMQAPGGPEEDKSNAFKFGGWSFHYWDDIMREAIGGIMDKPFDLLLGRKTYEIFAAHWPFSKEEPAEQINKAAKYVVSRTLDKVEWNNSILIKSNAVEEIRKLKTQTGPEIQVHGSSDLLQTLIGYGLIDQYKIWIFPVVLGNGKKLFGSGAKPSNMKLTDINSSGTGVIITTYEPNGDIPIGSFELENPTEAELARRRKQEEEISLENR